MTLLKSKHSADEKPRPVWFIVERDHGSTAAFSRGNRVHALEDFAEWLDATAAQGEGFTPYERGRRLSVIGPKNIHTRAAGDDAQLYIQPDDDAEDPLLYGDVALRAVLTDDEYRLYVQTPVVSALLES